METRFAHLYKRDSSVSMIRVRLSRRRSQIQKENREKLQNLRRCLDQLPEAEFSMDVSILEKSVIPAQETKRKTKAGNSAAEERKKMLARFKEQKALQREKEKREKDKKGVFKVGLYRPQPLGFLPLNPVVPSTCKTTVSVPSTRVTRSMKQQPVQKQLSERQDAPKKAEPMDGTRATRSSSRTVTATETASRAAVKPSADFMGVKTRSASRQQAAPSSGRGKPMQAGNTETVPALKNKKRVKEEVPAVSPSLPEEAEVLQKAEGTSVSFAPQGFVFQAPDGLKTFEPAPLSPRSAAVFLPPSFSFEPTTRTPECTSAAPVPSPSSPPPCLSSTSPVSAPLAPTPPTPSSPSVTLEPQPDVSYFRKVMASETERLSGLSELWEKRFDESSIPEEMRERMRSAVGQARLLMKERFGQFTGLVDDCELGRGEKVTTCSDLQGFWDMVYFQVEDVNKKFSALKEAESRGWQEETKTVAKQKKLVKKPPVAAGKPAAGGGVSAAAKSRLAAVKAALKAKHAAVKLQDESAAAPKAPANAPAAQMVVFHGGFFKVESPAKLVGAVRRSSRLSAAPLPQSSPSISKLNTPARLQRPTVASCASPLPHMTIDTPAKVPPPTAAPVCSPQCPTDTSSCSPKRPQSSPDRRALLPDTPPPSSHAEPSLPDSGSSVQPDLSGAPVDDLMAQPQGCHRLTEPEPPLHLPVQLLSAQPVEAGPESNAETTSSCQQAQEPGLVGSLTGSPSVSDSAVGSVSPDLGPSVSETSPLGLRASRSSPCMMSTTPLILSPATSDAISTNFEVTESPDAECVAALDFERYLQPSACCDSSPNQSPAAERFSLGVVDVEMESPLSQAEGSGRDIVRTPTALPRAAPLVFTPGTQQLMDNPLLYTPEQRNRVRQSVCDCDLMMFTPPSSQ